MESNPQAGQASLRWRGDRMSQTAFLIVGAEEG